MSVRLPRGTPRGFTLVEMVLVVGGVSVVLVLVGVLVHLLLRLESQGGRYQNDTVTIARLAEQFRADVHRAAEASITGADKGTVSKLSLTATNEPAVSYTWNGAAIEREEAPVTPTSPTHRERYSVERLSPVVFESKDGYVTIVTGKADGATPFRSKVRIEARLNRRRSGSREAEAKK